MVGSAAGTRLRFGGWREHFKRAKSIAPAIGAGAGSLHISRDELT